MAPLFKVESKDINDLNAFQLTKLLKLLLHLEARSSGIVARAIDVALNITVADGGEDGRIEWSGEPEKTEYLPCRLVQFQNKATDMVPADYADEIVNKRAGTLKHMVDDVLSKGGAYILFTTQELNETQKIKRITKIRQKLEQLGKSYANTAMLDIYYAAKIEGWVNKYISAIIAVLNWVGRPLDRGLKTWSDWNQYEEYLRFPFVADDERQSALRMLKALLTEQRRCARIIGLSGLGKTRLAFEVFRDIDVLDDLSKRVVYVDAGSNSSVLSLVCDWVQCGLEGIIVVDNCEVSLHEKLIKEIKRTDSKLSLLTLDYNLEQGSSQTETVRLKQLSDSHIKQMLEPVYGRTIPDIDRVAAFAQGFPQMAVLLADARLDCEPEMGRLNNDELARKMIWGGRDPIDIDEKILQGCALFDRFGLDDEVAFEYEFIAQNVVELDLDMFYACVKRFEQRGIIDRRGRFAMVVPKPLAIRLAAEWWRQTRPQKQKKLIASDMPDSLVESFCNQISRLDFLPEVKSLTEELCGLQGPFGQAEMILSDRGSRLFRSFVEVNPDVTSRSLSQVISVLNNEELFAASGEVRRNLVIALEKLCFHESCFEESATSLLLLASAENESWSNNATGHFKQLFNTFLSGTEAPPHLRLRVIDRALECGTANVRGIAIEAMTQAIDTHEGIRMVGAEYQGSGAPLQEWRPKVWGEAFTYWEEALQRLCELVEKKDTHAAKAKAAIANNIRGLMQYGRVDKLDAVIRRIVAIEGPLWSAALDNIKDCLRYEGGKMPLEGKTKLEEWIQLLTPTELGERLKLYVTEPPYEHEKGENGHFIDMAANNAKALATELSSDVNIIIPYLADLMTGDQRLAYFFASNLVQSAGKWEPLLSEVVERVSKIEKPNINFLLGILNGVFVSDSSQWEATVEKLSLRETLIPYYANIITSGAAAPQQLQLLVKLIHQKKMSPNLANALVYGRPLEHLSPSIVCRFALDLAAISDNAAWIASDILYMYCQGNAERWQVCKTVAKEIIIKMPINKSAIQNQHEMYHWKDITEKLLATEGVDFAVTISCNIIAACLDEISYSDLLHYVKPITRIIFRQHGREVWPAFSDAIKNADPLKKYRLSHLLNTENTFEKMKPSVLADLPDDLLRDWCFQEPDIAPKFVAEVTDIILETEEGTKISPRATFLIDNFGDNKEVLSALTTNISTFGWTGSLVPHYQRELSMFEFLKNHEKVEVREWVNRRIGYLTKMIDREKCRDEEHDWGIY
ncbi:MAG: hypothetical protein KKF00_10385 [Proteobacteria bacterium]|nr:hypothetical protein [Pseudomonadota bacterium]